MHATRYAPVLPAWPAVLKLRIVVLSDFHICDPFMDARRLRAICAQANALQPDLIVLLGDYLAGPRFSRPPAPDAWATPLAALSAPLGVHAVLGNHDYTGQEHRLARQQPIAIQHALETAGIPVYVNTSVRLEHQGRGFWLAGLGSQFAFVRRGEKWPAGHGMADLDATMNQVTTDEPVLLLAHEPDIFPEIPARVALTLSGHTHGGQVRLFGHAPIVPSRFGQRYLRGHIVEDGRHLIVSAGLGFSGLPIRLGAPAELLVIELGNAA